MDSILLVMGLALAVCGLVSAYVEKAQYAQPYGGRFGQAANGARVTIVGAFLGAAGLVQLSVIAAVVYLAVILLLWILIGQWVKRKNVLLKQQLEGVYGVAATDFKLTNMGLAYGKLSADGKVYRAYMNRLCKHEGDVLPEWIPGQVMQPTEAQRNLDTMEEMETNPVSVQKGERLRIAEVTGLTPRVVFPEK